ncbi:MAG: SusC/RagA family TonB-linked outer membrane protein [Chitinophagaceae bacterium]|nr:MAG: SusC/RagA family TonB-linked outer membrane protein [Chitinophagaceae bacterium]
MRKLSLLLAAFLFFTGSLLAQKILTGKITDETGAPVGGVSVVVKSAPSIGTVTGIDGNFSLTVPAGTTATELLVSSVGYETFTAAINDRTTIDVRIKSAASSLENVVITGYGTTAKKAFTGSTTPVNINNVRNQTFGSFDQALQGAGAGVSVVANSGQPGSNAIVRVRGNGSINGGNVPLYIMDGIEITAADFASINQGDFERLEILKDAVATGQYGSRGANGVVVITTRRGRAGTLMLNYDAQVGFSDLPENRLEVMNSSQKIDYELQRGNPYGWSVAEQDSLRNVNFNWQDALFRTGITQQHQISASGGNDKSHFYGSLSYMNQEGIVKTTGLKRYTARVNMDHVVKNWKFGLNLQGGFSNIVGTGEGNTFLSSPLNAIRWSNPYERDRNPVTGEYQETGGANTGQLTSGQPNGAMELFLNQNSSRQVKGIATSFIEFNFPFLKGLYARTNWGIDYSQVEGSGYTDRRTSTGIARQGNLTRSNSRTFRYTGTTSLNFKRTFGDHDIDFGAFTEVVKSEGRSFGFTGFGLTNGLINEGGITPGSVANPNFIPTVTGGGTENGILSYFGIGSYGYKGKYYVSGVVRRDGSSRFGYDNRWATFGSVGVNWVISDENFMSNILWMDLLKLRLSYGTNGNNSTAAGDFGQLPQLGRVNYAGINGLAVSAPGNLNYRWETNRTKNIGIDFGFFRNRLSGTVDVYDRETIDLFYDQPTAPETGFTSLPGNTGRLRNRGIEFTLRGTVIQRKDFRWSIEGNITYNQNKVLELPTDSIVSGLNLLAVGKPVGTFYLVRYAGVSAATGNALYYKRDGSITQVYSVADAVTHGTSVSPLYGGISTSLEYKGIDLSAQVNFFLKREMYNNDRNNVINPTYYFDNMAVEMLREWTKPGDITDVPRPSSSGGNSFQASTTRLLENANFWRLRNVTLGYSIPQSVLSRVGFRTARFFVQAQNWFTETKFQSFDPEFSGGSLTGAQYPALVQTTVGLTIGF